MNWKGKPQCRDNIWLWSMLGIAINYLNNVGYEVVAQVLFGEAACTRMAGDVWGGGGAPGGVLSYPARGEAASAPPSRRINTFLCPRWTVVPASSSSPLWQTGLRTKSLRTLGPSESGALATSTWLMDGQQDHSSIIRYWNHSALRWGCALSLFVGEISYRQRTSIHDTNTRFSYGVLLRTREYDRGVP